MGQGLPVQIDDIANATGINSDFLNDHNPNSPSDRTNTNDFLVDGVDGISDFGGGPARKCEALTLRGAADNGSYDGNEMWAWDASDGNGDILRIGDNFTFRIELTTPGRFVVRQIMDHLSYWTISTNGNASVNSITAISDGNGDDTAIEVNCSYDSGGTTVTISMDYNPPLNTDMSTPELYFQTDYIEEYKVELTATSISGGIEVNLTLQGGVTPYSWGLYRKAEGDSSFTNQVASGTESSDITDKLIYTETDCSNAWDYQVQVSDDSGDNLEDTTATTTCS